MHMSDNVPAIDPRSFWNALKARRLTFFSGVPDSTFQHAYNAMVADPDIRYIPAVREDAALGVASAAYFHGGLGGVMMQNSGTSQERRPSPNQWKSFQTPTAGRQYRQRTSGV